MVVTLGQQYNVGDKHTVILYTYINRHAGTRDKNNKSPRKKKIYIYMRTSGEGLIRGYTKFDFTVDEIKGRLNPSREASTAEGRWRNPV